MGEDRGLGRKLRSKIKSGINTGRGYVAYSCCFCTAVKKKTGEQ